MLTGSLGYFWCNYLQIVHYANWDIIFSAESVNVHVVKCVWCLSEERETTSGAGIQEISVYVR